jgi:hypothetical protein
MHREHIASCFAEKCNRPIMRLALEQIPGSFERNIRTHGLLCSKHPCRWTGLTRFDDNPIRWQKCECNTCKGFRIQFGACCFQCGRVPAERMYLGLLYHRGRISKDIRDLLLQALLNTGPFTSCGWCSERISKAPKVLESLIQRSPQDTVESNESDESDESWGSVLYNFAASFIL